MACLRVPEIRRSDVPHTVTTPDGTMYKGSTVLVTNADYHSDRSVVRRGSPKWITNGWTQTTPASAIANPRVTRQTSSTRVNRRRTTASYASFVLPSGASPLPFTRVNTLDVSTIMRRTPLITGWISLTRLFGPPYYRSVKEQTFLRLMAAGNAYVQSRPFL